jgi:hypothetical protein
MHSVSSKSRKAEGQKSPATRKSPTASAATDVPPNAQAVALMFQPAAWVWQKYF